MEKQPSKQPQEYRTFSYRWVNFVAYTFVTFLAGAGFASMAPMLSIMAARWGVGFGAAAMVMVMVSIPQVLFSLASGWLANKIGFKLPVVIGATLLAIGWFLRGTTDVYATFLLYCGIAGLGWGIIWAPVGLMIANWFPRAELGIANSLSMIGLLLGQAFGSLTAIAFFTNYGWAGSWRIYGVMSIVLAALAWLLLRERPAVPPSPRPPMKLISISEGIKQTMNRVSIPLQYTVLATVGSIAVAPSVLVPLLIGKGVAPPTAGIVSGLSLIGGVVGTLSIPPFAFKRRKVRDTMLLCAVLSPILFIAMFYAPLPNGSPWLVALLTFLFGFFTSPLMGISIGVGQTQPGVTPANASILTGVYLTSIGVGAAVIPQIVTRVVDAFGSYTAGAWGEAALLVISLVAISIGVPGGEAPGKAPSSN